MNTKNVWWAANGKVLKYGSTWQQPKSRGTCAHTGTCTPRCIHAYSSHSIGGGNEVLSGAVAISRGGGPGYHFSF